MVNDKSKKEVIVRYKGQLLTAYCYSDSLYKPILFPLNTLDGVTVTRGWPLQPRAGERTDHPHHQGVWMNYESVNGLDFWNNSSAIPLEKKNSYGTIRHRKITSARADKETATVEATADWLHPDGHTLLHEKTLYQFKAQGYLLLVDRTTTLTAKETVNFSDVKDGFFAIRLARELEMPSEQQDVFTDLHGNKTNLPKMKNNEGVTGRYRSSEGRTGDSVWGTRASWVLLDGKKDGKNLTVGIFDHPANVCYPAYWHARGYGLFAVNPFGRKVYSNGKEELNFTMAQNQAVTFRYRLFVTSAKISQEDVQALATDFTAAK